jgi:hypothetical protein
MFCWLIYCSIPLWVEWQHGPMREMEIGTAVHFILNSWTFVETNCSKVALSVVLICGEHLKLRYYCIFWNLVPHEVKTSISVGTWRIFPHIWESWGVTNEVLDSFEFRMGIDPMTICPRDKQMHLLSEVIMVQKHLTASFLDSAAVNWRWKLWNGLTWWEEQQSLLPDTEPTRSSPS